MRILLQNRTDLLSAVAGDTVQVEKTREALAAFGVDVELSGAAEPDLTGFDLVHLFNIMPVRETYRQFRNAKRQRKKVVLSPIYWDPVEYLQATGQVRTFGAWWEQTMPLRREIMAGVELILPNSQSELEALRKLFGKLPPAVIVPNAADPVFATATPDRFVHRYQRQDFLLSVGRICRRKNQLALIRVAKSLGYPLVLIGPLNDGAYYQECRRAAAGIGVLFVDKLSQTELASAYAAARVHALVSWYDTPGLVSLEAALAGCRIVSTDRGSTYDYLGDMAYYCNPADPASIKQAINAAWHSNPDPRLKQKILKQYSWEQAARVTYRAYCQVLGELTD